MAANYNTTKVEKVVASDSVLVDPQAKAKLQKAADSVGLSVTQLADLVIDSGAAGLPPNAPDGIAVTLTLKDLGVRMWAELQKVASPERTEWFQALLEPQRVALVVTLLDQGYRAEVVARELGISSHVVRGWHMDYADRVGAQVTQLRLSTIAGMVQLAAEKAQEGLLRQEDYSGFFAVTEKTVRILQSLGIVDQAIHRVEVTHKHEDSTQAEINNMIDLERKKQARLLEIQKSQEQQLDKLPELTIEQEKK